jgi:hypothetical protein
MTNLDAMCQLTFDRHQQLIAEAARRRMVSSGRRERQNDHAPARQWRLTLAAWLRGAADRLEPVADRPEVAMLRAVAHREISIDQALSLMDARNGHRSAIV